MKECIPIGKYTLSEHVVSPEPWGPVVSSTVSLVGLPHSTTVFIIIQFIVLN